MNMTLRIDPSLRRAVLAPTSVFAMGDEVSDLVLEFPHAAPDPDGLSLSLRRGGPSGDVVAIATAFSAVGSHRRLLSASVSLKTTVLDAWRLEVKAAADEAAASTAANPKKAPSPLQTAWLDVSSPSEVYASCPVPILLREVSNPEELLVGAVRYDKPQSLADREKATARDNIGAGEPYDPAPLESRVEALEAKSEQDSSFGAWKSGSSVALGAGAVAQGDGTLALHASGLDKVYLNAASAPMRLSDAVASAADAVVSSKGYATVQAATSLASSAAGSALETAKAHSDANLETAKSHSDANLDAAKAHSDANLVTAKSYADSKASGALGDAKSYADSKAAAVEAKIPSKVSTLENDSNFITSAQVTPDDGFAGYAANATNSLHARDAKSAEAVPWTGVTGKPTTLSGYGITDAATKSELASAEQNAANAISGVQSELSAKADLVDGKVPANQLPSYVDDVLEYDSVSAFPSTGEDGKIYVAKDTNKTYRWGGTQYVEISPSLALGETATTAYPGDKGKAAAEKADAAYSAAESLADGVNSLAGTIGTHIRDTKNPHAVTAAQVGAVALNAKSMVGSLFSVQHHVETGEGGDFSFGIGNGPSGKTFLVDKLYCSGKNRFFADGIVIVNAASAEGTSILSKITEYGGDFKTARAEVDNIIAASAATKADKATTLAGYGITDAATKTELNAKADKSALAAKADKSTTLAGYGITDGATKTELAALTAKVEYPLYAVPSTGLLKDRAINTTSLASVTVPDNFTDLLIRASVASSLSVTMPEAITTKYGDTFPGEAGEYLITITKTGASEAYVRTIKLEEVA